MTDDSVSNGVRVWRPLLHHPKDHIYEFAHKYGVPYFKDSTPSWSTRGKLRNKVGAATLCMCHVYAKCGISDESRIVPSHFRPVHARFCLLKND